MYVKMLVGYYAGQTRDIADHFARQLIASGQAEDIYAPPAETKPAQPETPAPKPETKKRK